MARLPTRKARARPCVGRAGATTSEARWSWLPHRRRPEGNGDPRARRGPPVIAGVVGAVFVAALTDRDGHAGPDGPRGDKYHRPHAMLQTSPRARRGNHCANLDEPAVLLKC